MNEAVITETYFMKCSDGIRLSIGMDGEDFTCCCSIVMKENEVENQLSSLFYTIGVPNMESCVGTQVRVISNGWGSIPYAIGHATKNVWFAMASDDPVHSPSKNTPEVHKNMDPMTVQELQEFYDHDEGFVWVVMSGVGMAYPAILDRVGNQNELVAVWCASTYPEAWLRENEYGKTWTAYRENPFHGKDNQSVRKED